MVFFMDWDSVPGGLSFSGYGSNANYGKRTNATKGFIELAVTRHRPTGIRRARLIGQNKTKNLDIGIT
jgi:hypothetical protein